MIRSPIIVIETPVTERANYLLGVYNHLLKEKQDMIKLIWYASWKKQISEIEAFLMQKIG